MIKKGYKLIIDQNPITESFVEINESTGEKKYIIRGVVSTPDKRNKNGRIYPKHIWEKEVQRFIEEDIKGNTYNTLCEWTHPPRSTVDPMQAVAKIRKVWWENDQVMGEFVILNDNSEKTNKLKALIDENLPIAVSTRGVGKLGSDNVVEDYRWICTDLVENPSNHASMLQGYVETKEHFTESWVLKNKEFSITENGEIYCDEKGCTLRMNESGNTTHTNTNTDTNQKQKECNVQSIIESFEKLYKKPEHPKKSEVIAKELYEAQKFFNFVKTLAKEISNDVSITKSNGMIILTFKTQNDRDTMSDFLNMQGIFHSNAKKRQIFLSELNEGVNSNEMNFVRQYLKGNKDFTVLQDTKNTILVKYKKESDAKKLYDETGLGVSMFIKYIIIKDKKLILIQNLTGKVADKVKSLWKELVDYFTADAINVPGLVVAEIGKEMNEDSKIQKILKSGKYIDYVGDKFYIDEKKLRGNAKIINNGLLFTRTWGNSLEVFLKYKGEKYKLDVFPTLRTDVYIDGMQKWTYLGEVQSDGKSVEDDINKVLIFLDGITE